MKYSNEIIRKLIHFGSAIFPIAYYHVLTRDQMLWLFGGLSVLFLIGEFVRLNVEPAKRIFRLIFGQIVRPSEEHRLTGATSVFISGFLTVLIFEKNVAVFAMLILSLADATAALIGRKWGKRSIFGKTVEGTVTFLIIAMVLAVTLPGLPRVGAVAAAVIATVAELLPSPIDDNLMIPLSAATTLSFFHLVA
ncbi:MAG: hypothetical protein VX822_05600 [Candidatus Neomarinimicrobiota bacterium]|nr:hypothetical protein [Candidatus Neomarinimicrobiota bacterium]